MKSTASTKTEYNLNEDILIKKNDKYLIKKSETNMFGLFATKNYQEGEIVLRLKGEIVKKSTKTSIRIGNEQHIEDKYGAFVNHCCKEHGPTTKVEECKLIAIKNIKTGEEITFDYTRTERNLNNPFICYICKKKIDCHE